MKPLYIAATLQDSGKTSFSLGLIQLLRERQQKPGYFKPVGQHYVLYEREKIDEDGVLMHQVFRLPDRPYCLSPIAIERGFTSKFIFDPDVGPLEQRIVDCADELSTQHSVLIVEGTGHAGVGSCFGLSNARVAQLLGANVIIVTTGGIGRPLDEIAVSLALFREHGVPVLGVVLNKVLSAKYERIRDTVARGLANLGTCLLGAIPHDPLLGFFTMGQLAEEFKYQVLCGVQALPNRIQHTVVAAMEPQNVVPYIGENTLVIVPGDRLANILIAINVLAQEYHHSGGLLLTGGIDIHSTIQPLLERCGIPVLVSEKDTFTVSSQMADLAFKIRASDAGKIGRLRELVEQHVDIPRILAACEQQ